MLTRLGLTPYSFRAAAAYYLAFIGLGVISASIGPALPFLSAQVQVTVADISSLVVAKSAGFMLGSFLVGRLADRVRAHGLLQLCLLASAACALAIPAIPDFAALLACLFLLGTFVGGVDVGGNIVIVWVFREKFAPFLTGLHFIWGLGALVSPLLIVAFVERTGDLRLSYTIIAGILLVLSLLFIRLPSPAPIRNREEARNPIPPRPMFTMVVMLFLAGTIELVVAIWILTYVLELGLADKITGGYLNSSFFLGLLGARLVSIFLLRRFSISQVLYGSLIIIAAGCLLPLAMPSSLVVLWIGVVLAGIGVAPLFPGCLNLAPTYLPPEGRVTSWMYAGASFGFLVMPWITGQLFESAGPHIIWYFALGGALLKLVLLYTLEQMPRYVLPGLKAGAPA
ncbi:MAG: MFS transporter [Caldilineaceae bacterium]|nr:MFS transporter [Caldilineaceae bacterium]